MAAADLERGWRVPDQLARALGFARSLAIYHGLPWRTRALRRHYAAFLGPGNLAFDVGAHVGNHTRCFAGMGARVIAIEPQPAFAAWLRRLFRARPQVTVLECALAAAPGVVELYRSPRTPTVATVSQRWIETVRATAGFDQVRWAEAVQVPATTLDALIARYGLPRFCKIDVEGYEAEVLRGLSQPIRALSFEYVPAAVDVARQAAGLLAGLASYGFNLTIGERRRFLWRKWRPVGALDDWLAARQADEPSGDVYARLEDRGDD
jgi:FkbM family methyltransferase